MDVQLSSLALSLQATFVSDVNFTVKRVASVALVASHLSKFRQIIRRYERSNGNMTKQILSSFVSRRVYVGGTALISRQTVRPTEKLPPLSAVESLKLIFYQLSAPSRLFRLFVPFSLLKTIDINLLSWKKSAQGHTTETRNSFYTFLVLNFRGRKRGIFVTSRGAERETFLSAALTTSSSTQTQQNSCR